MTPTMARAGLVAVAVVALVIGLTGRHAERSCDAANARITNLSFGHRGTVPAAVVDQLIDECHDARVVANAAPALLATGQLGLAARLADIAARRAPDDARVWLAVAIVRGKQGDRVGRRQALARERALNPLTAQGLGTAPPAPSAGAAAVSP